MKYQDPWAPVPASVSDWARQCSLPLPFSLCLWGLNSTATRLSGAEQASLAQSKLWILLYLVTIMGLVIPWSFTLALVDGYSVLIKCPIRQPGILLIIVVGDWVLSTLTLAAACSTASVVDLLLNTHGSFCPQKLCGRYRISAIMAFMSWFLSLASSLLNLWLLPSL
ncbi:hypothetical protein Fmac_022339 [Flemingia macrophylla]|uniref:CASP-like protein n=1 Tax=Flemingia macrophylla TaxID=520843 RepID=A0ABD1LZF0_9FABA